MTVYLQLFIDNIYTPDVNHWNVAGLDLYTHFRK